MSLACSETGEGTWRLRLGSLLVGPPGIASLSWPEWRGRETGEADPVIGLLRLQGHPIAKWRTFDQPVDGWRLVRFPMTTGDVVPWLTNFLDNDKVTLLPNGSRPITARAGRADALLRVFPHQNTPVGRLAAMAGRPVLGWAHPLDPVEGCENVETRLPPAEWAVARGQQTLAGATLSLAGLSTGSHNRTRPAASMLVGRLARRAWIESFRGGQPDLSTFEVRIRLDPVRIALWDLVVDLEETDSDGHLLSARRLRLGDIELPDHGAGGVIVRLPTLGSGVTRRIRLYDRDGQLLDQADDIHLVEQIVVRKSINGCEETMTKFGRDLPEPTLIQRLDALDRTDMQYQDLLASGMPGRVILPGTAGRDVLRSRLAAARGGLRVFDAYFGRDAADWGVFNDVTVPIRCLVGSAAVLTSAAWPSTLRLDVRRWTASKPPQPEFHDRAYLWDGGGLLVGTSPNGLGNRLSLIDPLDGAVSACLGEQFEVWWQDPRFEPLPPV